MNPPQHLDVIPNILQRNTLAFVQISFDVGHARTGVHNAPFSIKFLHPFSAKTPRARNTFPFVDWISFHSTTWTSNVTFVVSATASFFHMTVPLVSCGLRKWRIFHVPCAAVDVLTV